MARSTQQAESWTDSTWQELRSDIYFVARLASSQVVGATAGYLSRGIADSAQCCLGCNDRQSCLTPTIKGSIVVAEWWSNSQHEAGEASTQCKLSCL